MLKLKKLAFVGCMAVLFLVGPVVAVSKIVVSDEVKKALDDNYRIYERNARNAADKEVAKLLHAPLKNRVLFANQHAVAMPICDQERTPFEWKYVAPSEGERSLKYLGEEGLDAQYLRWTDSIWMRVAGSKEKFKVGMYCGRPFSDGPNLDNFVAIEIDQSFAENVRMREIGPELIDGALFEIASKPLVDAQRAMKGSVQLSGISGSGNLRVVLEMWVKGEQGSQMVASVPAEIPNHIEQVKTISVESMVDARSATHLILRLEKGVRNQAATGELSGRIFVFDARLSPLT